MKVPPQPGASARVPAPTKKRFPFERLFVATPGTPARLALLALAAMLCVYPRTLFAQIDPANHNARIAIANEFSVELLDEALNRCSRISPRGRPENVLMVAQKASELRCDKATALLEKIRRALLSGESGMVTSEQFGDMARLFAFFQVPQRNECLLRALGDEPPQSESPSVLRFRQAVWRLVLDSNATSPSLVIRMSNLLTQARQAGTFGGCVPHAYTDLVRDELATLDPPLALKMRAALTNAFSDRYIWNCAKTVHSRSGGTNWMAACLVRWALHNESMGKGEIAFLSNYDLARARALGYPMLISDDVCNQQALYGSLSRPVPPFTRERLSCDDTTRKIRTARLLSELNRTNNYDNRSLAQLVVYAPEEVDRYFHSSSSPEKKPASVASLVCYMGQWGDLGVAKELLKREQDPAAFVRSACWLVSFALYRIPTG